MCLDNCTYSTYFCDNYILLIKKANIFNNK